MHDRAAARGAAAGAAPAARNPATASPPPTRRNSRRLPNSGPGPVASIGTSTLLPPAAPGAAANPVELRPQRGPVAGRGGEALPAQVQPDAVVQAVRRGVVGAGPDRRGRPPAHL